MKNSFLYTILIALVLGASVSSCRSKRLVNGGQAPVKDHTKGYLLRHYEKSEFDFNWIGMKIDAEFIKMGETQGFKANIRMKKDSVIWISISPALGIEMFRVKITPDSLKYISKIPDNHFFFAGPFDSLSYVVKTELDFNMLQEILVGNAIGLERDEGKFRTEVDGDKYLLISKYKRRVRRVVGVDDRKLNPNDTIIVNPNDRRYQRALRKEDDMIVSRYWLEPDHFRLVRSIFNDLVNQRTVTLEYSDFVLEGEQVYPSKCVMNVKDMSQEQEIRFEITKIALNKAYETPFEVPEDYPRK